jgi:hypothetical protein
LAIYLNYGGLKYMENKFNEFVNLDESYHENHNSLPGEVEENEK